MDNKIKYPRRKFARKALVNIIKPLLKLLARPKISGLENFPRRGPLILVGNHTGAMEVVTMTVFAPWTIEYMGASDIPFEPGIAAFVNTYGFIPVFRGNVSRTSLEAGISVLEQGGVIGIFPEGGVWEPSMRQAHSGVAFLSHYGHAPVLPIGFGSMNGAMAEIFSFKRPRLEMNVGQPIPPVEIIKGIPRKQQYQEWSEKIMNAIWELVPEDNKYIETQITDEEFEFIAVVTDSHGNQKEIPEEITIKAGESLSRFLHRWVLFSTMLIDLKLPIQPLQVLADNPPLEEILSATGSILDYLKNKNPYYFTYRYGQREGDRMKQGIQELLKLTQWVKESGFNLSAKPLRRYTNPETHEKIVLDKVEETWTW